MSGIGVLAKLTGEGGGPRSKKGWEPLTYITSKKGHNRSPLNSSSPDRIFISNINNDGAAL